MPLPPSLLKLGGSAIGVLITDEMPWYGAVMIKSCASIPERASIKLQTAFGTIGRP
jgi:hypothetical protein